MTFEEWCHSLGFDDARVCKNDLVSTTVLKECWDYQQKIIDELKEQTYCTQCGTTEFLCGHNKRD